MLLPSVVRLPRVTRIWLAKPRGHSHEPGRGARVQAERVHDRRRHVDVISSGSAAWRRRRGRRAADRRRRGWPPVRDRTGVARAPAGRSRRTPLASLISIARLTPVTTSTRPASRNASAEVRRRAAEHVGEQQHAGAGVDFRDGRRDRRVRHGHVVVPADRHGLESGQIADDHFRGVQQFRGELAVRHDHDAGRFFESMRLLRRQVSATSRCRTCTSMPFMPPQAASQRLADRHRPVPAARAADANRQIRLPFRDVLRHQEPQQARGERRGTAPPRATAARSAPPWRSCPTTAAARSRNADSAGTGRRTPDPLPAACRAGIRSSVMLTSSGVGALRAGDGLR